MALPLKLTRPKLKLEGVDIMSAIPSRIVIDSLKKAIGSKTGRLTLQDASTMSALSLSDAKAGLTYLLNEYRGSLSVSSSGELLYAFPTGFSKPWQAEERAKLLWQKFTTTGLGILKLLVRAWISIVMVAYVVIFALILLAISFSKSSDRDESPSFSSQLMMHTLMRMIFDSLFWTFHPFSPFRLQQDHFYDSYQPQLKKAPFYQRVNNFFFGPEPTPFDKTAATKLVLQEIRAQKGRIGLIDIMRVTGLSKEEADPFMAKLMIDYDGDVIVSEEGGIFYEFASMRKSAQHEILRPAPSIWHHREKLAAFTGNSAGSNLMIICLNGFNLLMSSVAIANQWTIEKFRYILALSQSDLPAHLIPQAPQSTPLLLGWIPFLFSSALFLIPISRALLRKKQQREVNNTNGRRGLLKIILNKLGLGGIEEKELKQAWAQQAEAPVEEREFNREIIRLGGDLELDNKQSLYHFEALEKEARALNAARQKATSKEVSVGSIIFSSDT